MRRVSRGKGKKSDLNGDGEEEVRNDKDETGSTNDEETSKSSSRKRDAQGRAKTSEENKSDNEQDDETKENGKKQKESNPSDEEVDNQEDDDDSSVNKKKKSKQEVKKSPAKSKKKGKSPSKAQEKKSATKKKEEEEDDNNDEVDYEVEKIVDQRTIKGRRQFLVRWKGYSEESDTWENETNLNCEGLIEEFLAEQEEILEDESDKKEDNSKPGKINKSKKQDKKTKQETKKDKGLKKKETSANEDNDKTNSDAESTTEYEVDKIIEVHFRKDKTREFLVRWKGFSSKDDTWEPEDNLSCPDLIEKFMQKLDKIKNQGVRDLRENRCHTKRYVNTVSDPTNRHSRRTAKKERVNYAEEYAE